MLRTALFPTSAIHLFEGRVTSAGIACVEVTLVVLDHRCQRGGCKKSGRVFNTTFLLLRSHLNGSRIVSYLEQYMNE